MTTNGDRRRGARWICERDRLRLDPRADPEVRRTTIRREDRGDTTVGGPALHGTAKSGGKRHRGAPKGGEEARGHRAGAVRENDGQRID